MNSKKTDRSKRSETESNANNHNKKQVFLDQDEIIKALDQVKANKTSKGSEKHKKNNSNDEQSVSWP
jgi:hypothetical protein